jgi:hypothetical protein
MLDLAHERMAETVEQRRARIASRRVELRKEFKARIAQMEHEHVVRLLSLMQEFHGRMAAID